MRRLSLLLLFLAAAGPAHAFPVAEGAGAISSMVGVIAAAIAGLFPKAGLRGSDRHFIGALSVAIVMFGVALGASVFAYSLSKDQTNLALIAIQSRPGLELQSELDKRMTAEPAPAFTAEDRAYAEAHDLFLDLAEFRAGQAARSATRLYLDYDPAKVSDQPFRSAVLIPRGGSATLLEEVQKAGEEVLLLADHPATIVDAARQIHEATGTVPKGIALFSDPFSRKTDRSVDDLPRLYDPAHVFSLPMIDVRSRRDVLETHTLINAVNIPAIDLLLMRDTELEQIFPEGEVQVILSYDETEYARIERRLSAVVPGRYAFYAGGLQGHFFEDGMTITPYFYNWRMVDPIVLTEVYGRTGKLRFICTVPAQCLDNIPEKDRVDLPFREMEKAEFAAAIAALPKDALYVTVSSNQETNGNALLAGYWLVNSGHDYLGDLPMQDRFSLEELRAIIVDELSAQASLEDYREHHAAFLWAIEALRSTVSEHGWLLCFALLGAAARLLMAPLQLLVIESYYRARLPLLATLIAALCIPGILVWCYYFLDEAIGYYAVVPHQLMDALARGQVPALLPSFILMIALQVAISFPGRPRMAIAIIIGVAGIWGAGFMNALPLPLLVFLMASEAVALLLQLPAFASDLSRRRLARRGIYTSVPQGREGTSLPEKWRLLTRLEEQPGFLFDLARDAEDPAFRRQVARLKPGRVIVRSCSTAAEENRLGGVFESHIIDRDMPEILRRIDLLRADGCSHAWIQPLIPAEVAGVISSIGRNGKRGELVSGPPGAATEGGRGTETCYLDSAGARRAHRAEWKLLHRAERRFGAPVILEYSRIGKKVIPHQVRIAEEGTNPEVRLMPEGISGFDLAEDYLASCSRLTGDILTHVTGGDYAGVRGFLYRRKVVRLRSPLLTSARLSELECRTLELATALAQRATPAGPALALARLHEGLELLRCLYGASQSRLRPSHLRTCLDISALEILSGSELEVLGEKHLHADRLRGQMRSAETRAHIHDLIALATYGLNRAVYAASPVEGHAELTLAGLVDAQASVTRKPEIDAVPLTSNGGDERVVVGGDISGTPWSITNGVPAEDVAGPLILTGEEIGSEWVRHLPRFAGIVSVYGHPNSHLGLSARALGIPYRKVSPAGLSVFLETGRLD